MSIRDISPDVLPVCWADNKAGNYLDGAALDLVGLGYSLTGQKAEHGHGGEQSFHGCFVIMA